MNEFERQLLESPTIPTLPAVAQRLLELLGRPQPELEELAQVIAADPSLSARIISLINSPVYGVARQISSLREAVLYLGLRTVQSVALSLTLLSTLRSLDGDARALDSIWRTSLMTALATRRLASESGAWDPEEAFLAGLVEQCGALMMLLQVPGYGELVARHQAGEKALLELEREELESDHGRIAVLLLEKWGFPAPLVHALQHRFDPENTATEDPASDHGRILLGAALMARSLSVPGFTGELLTLERRLSELLSISGPAISAIAAELPGELRRAAEIFDIPIDEQLSYEELLAEANEKLSRLTSETDRSARDLADHIVIAWRGFERMPSSDEASLERDETTDILGAEAFETLFEACHRRARQLQRSIGLLIIGIDDLKRIGEDHGPAAADETFRQIARRVSSLIRRTDSHGRLGDYELGLLTPGCARHDLPSIAERIRLNIESAPIESSVGPIHPRMAIGMAGSLPHHDRTDARTMLNFAFTALEEARSGSEPTAMRG